MYPSSSLALRRLFSFLILLFAVPALFAASITVEQGQIARWEGAESCGMDGKTWKAVEGNCWYPIDMERAPGRIEIARWQGGQMETAWVDVVEVECEIDEIDFPDDSLVHLSEEDLNRHHGEQAQIKPLFRRRGPAEFNLALAQPLDPMPNCGGFGVCRVFNGVAKNRHSGIDCAVGMDNPVMSIATGEVVLTGEHLFAGKSVYVDHGDGLITMYFHLNKIEVEVGQQVARGEKVGLIGSTGRSTGPHLHLGARWRGARVDPNSLLGDLSAIPTVGGE